MRLYTLTEKSFERRRFRLRLFKYSLILAALAISYLSIFLWNSSLGMATDSWALKQAFKLRGELRAPEEIVIIGIDEATKLKFGNPIPRSVLVDGLENLIAQNPKILIFDLSFPPDPKELEVDRRLGDLISKIPSTIGAGKINTDKGDGSFVTIPSDPIYRNAAKLELEMLLTEVKETISYISKSFDVQASLYTKVPLAKPLVEFANLEILAPGAHDLINFYGKPGQLKSISLLDLVDNKLSADLENKIVFIGFHDSEEKIEPTSNNEEFRISAYNQPMYGVEIHATIAGNLIERNWIRNLNVSISPLFVQLSCFLICLSLIFLSSAKAYLFVFTFLISNTFLVYKLFADYRIWLPGLASIWVFAISSLILAALYREIYLQRLNRFIQERLDL